MGIRQPFCLRHLMRGEGFEVALDAELVAHLKGPVAEDVCAVPPSPAACWQGSLSESHACSRQDDPSALPCPQCSPQLLHPCLSPAPTAFAPAKSCL